MKSLIMNNKWRWFASVAVITFITIGAVFLSNAFAQRKLATQDRPAAAPAQIAAPIYINGGFTFAVPKRLVRPPLPPTPGVTLLDQDLEPEIKIDIFGNIYVAAINGVPGGTDLWKSTDNGATAFQYLGHPDGAQDHCGNPPLPVCVGGLGGADDSIDVSPSGFLYVSSLSIASVTMSTSFDGGTGGVAPGQAWQVQPLGSQVPADDRQWIAADGPETVYLTMRQAPGTSTLYFFKSTDAGKTFLPAVPLTTTVSREANIVVDPYNGNIYTGFTHSGNPRQMSLLRSTDGGTTWVPSGIYTGPAGTTLENAFTIFSLDRGGNLHLVFAQSTGINPAVRTNCHIFLTSSANPSAAAPTWTTPVRVDAPPVSGSTSSVMPWIVGGSPGTLAVTWYQSSSASPDQAPFDWHVYFAQITNALTASPTIAKVLAYPNQVHDAAICAAGTGCPTGTRDLAEYYTVTLDPEGKAHIAYVNGIEACGASNCRATVWHTKQTSGASAYTPPAPPAPATFAPNIAVGSPGAEPGLWVDSFNCIYVTAPGGPFVWKSVNKGASFLPPVNPVSDELTLTGGDEDVISLPKQNGSGTRPDQLYFTDLGLSSCHIRKSTDGGASYFKPGPGGAAGDVSISSDRQWLAGDQGFPTAADQIIYHWEHELVSEAMRISSLVNDTAWQSTSGITDPELIDPQTNTLPNTNPGPIFVNKATHRVFGLFNGSVPSTNAVDPPFGKLLNVWETDAAPPATPATPVTDVQNHPVFKGVYDSATNPPPAQGPPTGPTYGTNNANIFPAGDIDSAGNIYVAWTMNNSRTNEFSVWMAISRDQGKTYYGPFPVSSGPLAADETTVFPWVAAGDAGRVNIVYYKTTTVGDPNTLPDDAEWNVFFAQSLNANTREPVFRVSKVSDHVMHEGQISTGGLIGSADRSLLDFFEVANGPDGVANIIYADNGATATHAEFARQNSGPVVKVNPNTAVTCLELPLELAGAVSRKTHGSSGAFDINLPPTGPRGVECRTGTSGAHTIVFTFPNVLTGVDNASSTNGTVSSRQINPNDPHQYIVNLTGVINAQYATITLTGVHDTAGNTLASASATMGVLLGDTTPNGAVNSSDIGQTKSRSGQFATGTTFRSDVTVNGTINSSDIALVKSKSGTALPQPP